MDAYSSKPRSDEGVETQDISAGRVRHIKKHARTKHRVRMRKKSRAVKSNDMKKPSVRMYVVLGRTKIERDGSRKGTMRRNNILRSGS
jgi:hypothetical protein